MKRRCRRSAGVGDWVKKGLSTVGLMSKESVEADRRGDWLKSNADVIGKIAVDYASISDFVVVARSLSDITHQMTFSGAIKSLKTLSTHLGSIGESKQKGLVDEAISNMEWLYREMPGLPSGYNREKKLVETFGPGVLVPIFAGVVNMRKNVGAKRASFTPRVVALAMMLEKQA